MAAASYNSANTAKIFSQVGTVKLGSLGEVPVIEGSVTVNTGSIDKTEIKLINGTVWTSKTTKGDSDVSFQIPALDSTILTYFFGAPSDGKYSLGVKQQSNQLVEFVDSDGVDTVSFQGCEVYGALVLGDGDNPAYINVVVTVKDTFSFTQAAG